MKEPCLYLDATKMRRGRSSKCADTRVAERPSGHCAREAEHGLNVSTGYDTPVRLRGQAEPLLEFRFPVLDRDRSLSPLSIDSELDAFVEQRHTVRSGV